MQKYVISYGYVMRQAIPVILALAGLASLAHAQSLIVDNVDAGAVPTGTWSLSSYIADRYGANYLHDGNAEKGLKSVAYAFTLPEDGTYEVSIFGPASSTYASNTPFDVIHAAGTATVMVNQRIFGGGWRSLGAFVFSAGSAPRVVIRTDATNGTVIADAVRLTRVGVTVDNNNALNTGGSLYAVTGSWSASTSEVGFYGTNYHQDGNTAKGTKTARFTPNLPATGRYELLFRWPAKNGRSTNTPIDIFHHGGTESITLDQTSSGQRGNWVSLGTYWFLKAKSGSALISTTGTSGHVIADAMTWVPVAADPTDSNANGLPDAWELHFLGSLDNQADADPDNDMLTNLQEYQIGTDPASNDTDGDGMLDGPEVAAGLDPFTNDASLDPDADGLTNAAELAAGTSPFLADSDHDGMSDSFELAHGLNPLVDDAAGDLDNDGLSNLAEFQAGTLPNNPDTDGDQMSDGFEVAYGFNPLSATDGWMATITFSEATLLGYGGTNDATPLNFEVLDEGSTLRMWGNNWKAVALNRTLTATMTLRFDFRSDGPEGEIFGVALDTDLVHSPDRTFQIWGTQTTWSPLPLQRYPGAGWSSYITPIAGRITGNMKYVGFLNDDDAQAAGHVLYRDIAIGEDADADGLFNVEEAAAQTNPRSADTDGDGIPDGLEVLVGLDPRTPDADGDADLDQIPNGFEALHGLNPFDASDAASDFDGDGYSALVEYQQGTNPNVWEDVTAPVLPAAPALVAATDTSLYLAWPPAIERNISGLVYDVYRDGALIRTLPASSLTDTGLAPATAYAYTIVARDAAGNASPATSALQATTASSPNLPESWAAYDLGTHLRPGASARHEDGKWVVSATGIDMGTAKDHLRFVCRPVTGDFRITARLEALQQVRPDTSAGLMLKTDLNPMGHEADLWARVGKRLIFQCRDGWFIHPDIEGAVTVTPQWLRLERRGNTYIGWQSSDGLAWRKLYTHAMDLPAQAYVGLFVCGWTKNGADAAATAIFDHVSIDLDADSDGLYETEEIAQGTSDASLDSDGDGYSDYEETRFLFTNPAAPELGAPITVSSAAGSSAAAVIGAWTLSSAGITNSGIRGAIEFTVAAPEPGIYRLAIHGRPSANSTSDTLWNVDVSIGGRPVDRAVFDLANGEAGTVFVYTPWLPAGSHTVRLYLDNVSLFRKFTFTGLDLQRIPGPDANSDGVTDWMENRLAHLNSVAAPPASATSPLCLEGRARFVEALSISAAGQACPVHPGVADGWYADVPLDPSGAPAEIAVSHENGGLVSTHSVAWSVTDVLTAPDLAIRRGDALRLGAVVADPQASVALTIRDSGGAAIASYATTSAVPMAHIFDAPGAFTVEAVAAGAPPASLAVTVQAADFGAPAPVATVGFFRDWAVPGLPAEALLEVDARLNLEELAPPATGGRLFRIRPNQADDFHVLARLDDGSDHGPILASIPVRGLAAASSAETGLYHVMTYPDGTRLIEMKIVLSEVPADIRLSLDIFISGVTFDDGTTLKEFTAADFDATGVLTVRFLKAASVGDGSACHKLRIYQGNQQISIRSN
jgi:hypothetical protein